MDENTTTEEDELEKLFNSFDKKFEEVEQKFTDLDKKLDQSRQEETAEKE